MARRPLILFTCVAALAGLGLVSCADDGGDIGSAVGPVTTAAPLGDGSGSAPPDRVNVEAKDFAFAPTKIDATAGSSAIVRLRNSGAAAHTFTIEGLGVDQTAPAGQEVDVVVPPGPAGEVVFFCRFHRGGGMQGTLVRD